MRFDRDGKLERIHNAHAEELREHWEQILASEGMPADLPIRYIRATTPNKDGNRPRHGPREIQADAIDDRRQDPTNTPRPDNQYAALMAEPHKPVDTYPSDKLIELREQLLDAMEELLDPPQIELITAAVLGDETYAAVGARLGMPHSTAWYTTARALRKLHDSLQEYPAVVEYLERHDWKDE